jgi:predicted alpha/beta hydrolase family esterase
MRLLEKLSRPVKCTVLVAPPLKQIGVPEIDALNNSFLEEPFAWELIRKNAGELAFLMGDDDQYVPQEQLLAIAKALDISPIVIAKGGHLNAETGYTELPSALELLRVVLGGGRITRTWCDRADIPHI